MSKIRIRGKNISPEIKTKIKALSAYGHNAKKIEEILSKEYESKKSIITPKYRTIAQIIKDNKPSIEQLKNNPQNKQWSLATNSEEVPLHPGTLNLLLKIQKSRLDKNAPMLTIREAKWLSKLYTVILILNDNKELPNMMECLDYWIWNYSVLEQVQELSDININTSQLDKELLETAGDIAKLDIDFIDANNGLIGRRIETHY